MDKILKKIEELGFKKVNEPKVIGQEHVVIKFEKHILDFNYVHAIDIVKVKNEIPFIWSYQKNGEMYNNGFKIMVGINMEEVKMFLELMKELEWDTKK